MIPSLIEEERGDGGKGMLTRMIMTNISRHLPGVIATMTQFHTGGKLEPVRREGRTRAVIVVVMAIVMMKRNRKG
jgi:hypothetical protein